MPRFHLHLRRGPHRIEDRTGAEYANLMSARAKAIVVACSLYEEGLRRGDLSEGSRFEISDTGGEVLLILSFQEALLCLPAR